MPPVGFEPTVSAGEQPQTYALDRAATGTGIQNTKSPDFLIRTRRVMNDEGRAHARYVYLPDICLEGLRKTTTKSVI